MMTSMENAMPEKLILIDGTALAYRNHFSMIRNPLRNSRGVNTSALFGVLNSLAKIIREQNPDYIIFSFDSSKPTFRHEKYPEYKSTRAKMPDELSQILPVIKLAVEALNIPVLEIDGVEADDVVGTIANKAAERGIETIIYTGDKDFLQLLRPGIKMLAPGRAQKPDILWTHENAFNKFGVEPEQIVDLLALMGDSSDNIPGVPGIGEKTAVKLLKQWGSLDNIYANLDKIKGSVRKKLAENKDSAYLSRELATIRQNLPIEIDFDRAKLQEPDGEKLLPILKEYELASLVKKFLPEHTDTEREEEKYILISSLDELSSLADELLKSEKICFDTETTSTDAMTARLVGISFTNAQKKGFYIPIAHRQSGGLFESPDNIDFDAAKPFLKKIFSSDIEKIGQNIKYDMKVLKRAGIDVGGNIFDTMIAAYLIDPGSHQHGLDFLALKFLGHTMTSYSDVAGKGKSEKNFDEVEPKTAAKYSAEDVDITFRLAEIFERKLKEMNLWELFRKLEMPLVPVLMDMEMTGIALDEEYLSEIGERAQAEMEKMRAEIFALAGEEFNIDSPKQLSHILFDVLGIPPVRRTKTGYSTDAQVMQELELQGYEIAEKIVRYREMSKLLSTYIHTLPKLVNAETGRIHTTFNQAVAATGRLSSSDPNLQNIPIRNELGAEIRKCFIPEDGWLMMSADYSQIELRLLAHFSEDENLVSAFLRGEDIHNFTASLITGLPQDAITPKLRRIAKTVNFGIMYGQSSYGLAQQLKITNEEAAAFIDNYFKRYPKVRSCLDSIIQFAEENGYVETIMGRRRYLPDVKSESHQMREAAKRAAINTPFQGSAADIIKMAMISIHRELEEQKFSARMLLQVHDELVFEFPPGEEKSLVELVREKMSNVVKLKVPLVVDIGIGRNWGEAH
ncbi:DNA polymerase I [bacterium]|nr:DNA polymerase I [bacterium]